MREGTTASHDERGVPGDFIWTPVYYERCRVVEKDARMNHVSLVGSCAEFKSFHMSIQTSRGNTRIDVSRKFFELSEIGDIVLVSYRIGRWTEALKAELLQNYR